RVLFVFYRGNKLFLQMDVSKDFSSMVPMTEKPKTPDSPSDFCFAIRKHLENARLKDLVLHEGHRLLNFVFETEEQEFSLFVDFQSSHGNIYLVSPESKLLACHNHNIHFDHERLLNPSHPHPSFRDVEWKIEEVKKAIEDESYGYFVSKAKEFTPKLMQWILVQEDLNFTSSDQFIAYMDAKITGIKAEACPHLTFDEIGMTGFSVYPENEVEPVLMAAVLEDYFSFCESGLLLRKVREKGLKLINVEREYISYRRGKINEKLELYQTYNELERVATLCLSQQDAFRPFCTSVKIKDYFSECEPIELKIDPKKSVMANIDNMFNKAKKYQRGIPRLDSQLIELEESEKLLERTLNQIRHEIDLVKLDEFIQRLQNLGIFKGKKQNTTTTAKKKTKKSQLRLFYSSEGCEIYAGRNDKENDYLVKQVGKKEDTWFHVKDVAGSHIILKKKPDSTKTSVLEAAQLAAYYSSKKNDTKAQVIFTHVKYVK
ncbi:NFACT RNA binding domain-containing protein, partial [bacterium]|nr:NFACT RNA binding domain-containing protein [bacterium]